MLYDAALKYAPTPQLPGLRYLVFGGQDFERGGGRLSKYDVLLETKFHVLSIMSLDLPSLEPLVSMYKPAHFE